jgi:hypothetical protein
MSLAAFSHPTNVTMLFMLFGPGQPVSGTPIGSQITDSGGFPALAGFNTNMLADGTYMVSAVVIDSNDTNPSNLSPYQMIPFPCSMIVMNTGPQDITRSCLIPNSLRNTNYHNESTDIDYVTYRGVPQTNVTYEYPDVGFIPPVYSTQSPYNPAKGGNPAVCRTMNYWGESISNARYFEYTVSYVFQTTAAGGGFASAWNAQLPSGAADIEGSYAPVAMQSYKDGGRLNNQVIGNSINGPMPPSGPFNAYHWWTIQIDGALSVLDVFGNKLTIAGPKADPDKLPMDSTFDTNPPNPYWPNTLQVGTISTNPSNTFRDFGGSANDMVWDPRNAWIAYVALPMAHCIIVADFTDNPPYGPSNPLCYRYAGYQYGVSGDGRGGYLDGPALGTVTNGVQWTASFTGTISGTTLTASNVTGTIGIDQCLTDHKNPSNIMLDTYIQAFISGVHGGAGEYRVNNSQIVSTPEPMYTNDGAQFAGPYSIAIQMLTTGVDPLGTIYVADHYNCLVRKILPTSSPGVAGAVSTLFGNQAGIPPAGAHNGGLASANSGLALVSPAHQYSVSSYSDNGNGTTAVVLSTTPSPVPALGWKVVVYVNGSLYRKPGGDYETGEFAIYTITAFTSATHFSMNFPYPGAGATVSIVISNSDAYSGPGTIPLSRAYIICPQVVRMTSRGNLVVGEAWYNIMARYIDLTAQTIRRIGPTGNLAQTSIFPPTPPGGLVADVWGWLDVDKGNGKLGACGPLDDIVMFKMDSNPGSAATAWRWSLDGTFNASWPGQQNSLPSEGAPGVGHYPWGFTWSRTEFKMLSNGRGMTGFTGWRPAQKTDPDQSVDNVIWQTGVTSAPIEWAHGTSFMFPMLLRPSFKALYGDSGQHYWGQNVLPCLDQIPGIYNTNSKLITFIQGGCGGMVPRPELSCDPVTNVPGRGLAAIMYFIKRQSMAGSFPSQTPPLFTAGDTQGSGILITPGTWPTDCIRPIITVTSISRVSATQIQCKWTTNKPTIGLVAAATPNSYNKRGFPYYIWSPLETGFGTAHNITITGLPDNRVSGNSPTHINIVVKDYADNWNCIADTQVA